MQLRRWLGTAAAVLAATFTAGALVSLRLHLRLPAPLDWAAILAQGLEICGWFSLFAFTAVAGATHLLRMWPGAPAPRLLVALVAHAFALVAFVLVFARDDLRVFADGLVHLYLAAGSLAGAMAAPPPPRVGTRAAPVIQPA